ncbi:MAG: HAD family hydrolase [Bacteroidota bacterium]
MPTTPPPVRIAMWSGPRNVSTATMRAWGSRADTAVSDEPLYAAYLATTGKPHPMRTEVMASQPTDWREVAEHLSGPAPGGAPIWYQKHMAHHLTPEVGREWLRVFRHAFLIREPAAMLASLAKVLPDATLADTGLPQQVDLFDRTADRLGHAPPVLDGRAVRDNPEGSLRSLCTALGVPWDPTMLTWAPGPRETDGVWGPVWYTRLYATTGFAPPDPPRLGAEADLPARLRRVLTEAVPLFERLSAFALRTTDDGRPTTG